MAGAFSSGDDDLIAGINVTPLVDVVLVLLVIFLITAPVLYQSAIKVQLPKARSGQEAEKTPLDFTITRDGSVMLGKESIAVEQIEKRLLEMKLGPDQTASISADEATPHGGVIKVMDALRQAGLTRFALTVEGPAKR
jgi:biopolymer transport protein ExbD